MIKTILFQIRDFVYIWLKKNHGEKYAQQEFLFRVGVFWTLYYFAIVFALVLIFVSFFKFNFSQETILLLRKNFLIKILGGGLIFLPYYLWLKFYLFKLLEVVPENFELDDSMYKKLAWKTFFIFLLGLVIILIIALINNIVRHGHF